MRSLPLHGAPPESVVSGPPIAAKGFRPFFLLAAALATLFLPLWLLVLSGRVRVDAYVDPIAWHSHEMVFGFSAAVVAGFLLTAVGNWTGKETAIGKPLLALAALWIAGRIALLVPGGSRLLVAAIELAFLPALAITIARPLVATKNRRNMIMLVVLAALWLADLAFHLVPDARRTAVLFAVDVIVLLVVLIGARVFPMFTRNATGDQTVASKPRLDKLAALAVAALALVDLVRAAGVSATLVSGTLAAVAAVLVVARASRWGARGALKDPMLWVLHAGHAWIAVGLVLRAASTFAPSAVPSSLATHALTAGVIGTTTLGMMARVALGHSGRTIRATRLTTASFALVTLAALVRVFGPLVLPSGAYHAVVVSGLLWTAAFGAYLVGYAPVLLAPRVDGKPG